MTRREFSALPFLLTVPAHAATGAETNWPSFRGPLASGVADGFPLPVDWKVKWKSPVAGLGHSSPIIWGDRLFVATAVGAAGKSSVKLGLYGDRDAAQETGEQSWKVLCIDKHSGKMLWEHTAQRAVPRGVTAHESDAGQHDSVDGRQGGGGVLRFRGFVFL